MHTPCLRHPISLRGLPFWLNTMADTLTAYAEQPVEVREVARSLRSKANTIRRDPEWIAQGVQTGG